MQFYSGPLMHFLSGVDTPLTDVAQTWVSEHLVHEESLYWCGALVVEPRYLDPIVAGMTDEGLVITAG
jgi:hypothetical protein